MSMWANDKLNGRWWCSADRATMTDFGDCVRVNLYWDDGAEAYFLEDTKDEAIKQAARLGFAPNA